MKKKCPHGKQKYYCKECGGKGICEHGVQKFWCKQCGSKGICEHGHIKSKCVKCKGTAICKHDRIKYTCKECKGSSICEHNKIRCWCQECGGGSICKHNRKRTACKECKGSSVCEHNKAYYSCKKCGTHLILIKSGFTKEEIQIMGFRPHCDFPDCLIKAGSRILNSDHDHKCHPTSRMCFECYRGELCPGHNRLLKDYDEHPEWATAAALEYMARRPFSKKLKTI